MNKLDFSNVEISYFITHEVGNRGREESLHLSDSLTVFFEETSEHLHQYLFSSFKSDQIMHFAHAEDVGMNGVYSICQEIFTARNTFKEDSQNLAKLLYEETKHPQIAKGELHVLFIENILIGDLSVNGIGIFKSESKAPFLQLKKNDDRFDIEHEFGYEMSGLDKGCLVLDTYSEDGYDVFIIDKKGKSGEEAQFWKSDFLGVRPVENEYFQTNIAMEMPKNFIESSISDSLSLNNTEKIAILSNSRDFFKENEHFDKGSFEEAVFSDDEIKEGYRAFEQRFATQEEVAVPDNFNISKPAVKKSNKFFKSVLKLDKNFSIYVHGDKNRMERSEDENGKFYKFYYDVEQ